MRREDKQITDRKEIDAIIHGSKVCRLAMSKENQPYLVPLSFGYDGKAIYVHTAGTGHLLF
ncbi:MAG: pyridoxamine 5'-phosphate oxidase family protein [Desulfobacteraceae bacterium]